MTLNFAKTGNQWVAEYTGDSGVLQVKRNSGGRLYVYGDAGIGYTLMEDIPSNEMMRYLNMEGLVKVKIVSDTEVIASVVNN